MPGMGYPVGPPARRPVSGLDLAASIVALLLTVLLGLAAAVFGVFLLAFLDHCPPETCSAEGAFTAVATALAVAAVIGASGLMVTIVQLTRRRPAWPFAVATLLLCVVTFFLGGMGYGAAVGA